MMDAIGWAGALLFAFCAVPQAVASYRQGHSAGMSWAFLQMWLWGEILTLIYVWPKQDWPLITNYLLNLACLCVIVWFRAYPRREK